MRVISSTSDPVIKPRYDKPQNGKNSDSRDTRGRHLGISHPKTRERRACSISRVQLSHAVLSIRNNKITIQTGKGNMKQNIE